MMSSTKKASSTAATTTKKSAKTVPRRAAVVSFFSSSAMLVLLALLLMATRTMPSISAATEAEQRKQRREVVEEEEAGDNPPPPRSQRARRLQQLLDGVWDRFRLFSSSATSTTSNKRTIETVASGGGSYSDSTLKEAERWNEHCTSKCHASLLQLMWCVSECTDGSRDVRRTLECRSQKCHFERRIQDRVVRCYDDCRHRCRTKKCDALRHRHHSKYKQCVKECDTCRSSEDADADDKAKDREKKDECPFPGGVCLRGRCLPGLQPDYAECLDGPRHCLSGVCALRSYSSGEEDDQEEDTEADDGRRACCPKGRAYSPNGGELRLDGDEDKEKDDDDDDDNDGGDSSKSEPDSPLDVYVCVGQPVGASCFRDELCQSGYCKLGACACTGSKDCPGSSYSSPPATAASKYYCIEGNCRTGLQPDGESCGYDGDCSSGTCAHSSNDDLDSAKICCPEGAAYKDKNTSESGASGRSFKVCGNRPAGASCFRSAMCASGVCNKAKQAVDGTCACATNEDCDGARICGSGRSCVDGVGKQS